MSREIKHELHFSQSPTTVYGYVSEPEQITQWFSDRCDTTDQGLRFEWDQEGGGTNGFEVIILTTEPGRKFAYESIEDNPTTTTFELEADGDGCKLTLIESGFSDDYPNYDEHVAGWQYFMGRLQQLGPS